MFDFPSILLGAALTMLGYQALDFGKRLCRKISAALDEIS